MALRKVLLLGALAVLAAAISWTRVGPSGGIEAGPGAERLNLVRHLSARHLLQVDVSELRVVPSEDAPAGHGRGVRVWFSGALAGQPPDLYSLRARLGEAGVPVVAGAPSNLSRSPEGGERLLEAGPGWVLFGLERRDPVACARAAPAAERCFIGAALLDFRSDARARGSVGRGLSALLAWQRYGSWTAPTRTEVAFGTPSASLSGRVLGTRLSLEAAEEQISVDLRSHHLEGGPGTHLLHLEPPSLAPRRAFTRLLSRAAIFGASRAAALSRGLRALEASLRQTRQSALPRAAGRVEVPELGAPGVGAWPPAALLPKGQGLPEEGRWQPVEGTDDLVLRSFLRADPARREAQVHLFAFDTRGIALHFSAGQGVPASRTGVSGSAALPPRDLGRPLARFDGPGGELGAIEAGREIVAPAPGVPTLVHDRRGRFGVGLWDAARLVEPWTGLRQARALPSQPESPSPGAALGLGETGVLFYAWSVQATGVDLRAVMARLGARSVLRLSGRRGLQLYGAEGPRLALPEEELKPQPWGVEDDSVYLLRAEVGARRMPGMKVAGAPGEGRWRPARVGALEAPIALGFLGPERTGGAQIRLARVDTSAVQVELWPGLAEEAVRNSALRPRYTVPAELMARFGIGLRLPGAPGLRVGDNAWAPLRGPALTVDAGGRARLGAPDPEARFELDGRALVREGRVLPGVRRFDGPVAGLGMLPDGDLLLAAEAQGDAPSLARALVVAGARRAVVIGGGETARTGRFELLQATGGAQAQRWLGTEGWSGVWQASQLRAGAGSALLLVGKPQPPRARHLETFRAD